MASNIRPGSVVQFMGEGGRRYVVTGTSPSRIVPGTVLVNMVALSGGQRGSAPGGINENRLFLSRDQTVEFTGAIADALRRRYEAMRAYFDRAAARSQGLSGIGGFVAGMFGASPSGPHIKVSYSIVTPESAEDGDYAESGWEDEEGMDMTPDQYDVEEGLTAVDKAVSNLRAAGAVEPSSSQFHKGVWYSDGGSDDYRTGERTERNYHLRNFTEEQERAIFDQITKRRR